MSNVAARNWGIHGYVNATFYYFQGCCEYAGLSERKSWSPLRRSFIELAASENFNVIDDQTLDYLLRLEHLRVNECELSNILLR